MKIQDNPELSALIDKKVQKAVDQNIGEYHRSTRRVVRDFVLALAVGLLVALICWAISIVIWRQ